MKIYTKQEFEAMQVSVLSQNTDNSGFETACAYFRQICSEIGSLIGNSEFRGGYDDMPVFYAHESYKTDKGVQLAIAWAGVNDLCKYEASKLGIGSPDWWYRCWEDKSNSSSNGVTNPEPLYYNIQLSTEDIYINEDSMYYPYKGGNPLKLLEYVQDNGKNKWIIDLNPGRLEISQPNESYTSFSVDGREMFIICEGPYPVPEYITVESDGFIFHFRPIPVYE